MRRAYLRLKACPRCRGDILVDRATEDTEVCIQCGYRNYRELEYTVHPRNLAETEEYRIDGQAGSKITGNLGS